MCFVDTFKREEASEFESIGTYPLRKEDLGDYVFVELENHDRTLSNYVS